MSYAPLSFCTLFELLGKRPPAADGMDPVSALALACNVLDMVDRAVTYGKTIKEIYESANGLSSKNDDLESVIQSMAVVTEDLENVQGDIASSRPDAKMQEIVEGCATICVATQDILTKCKPKREKSVRSAAAASIRALLNKSDLDKFQAKLEKASKSLSTLISAKTL